MLPVPAGGLAVERVRELVDVYGPDVMLLIGGSLLMARDDLVARTRTFTQAAQAAAAVCRSAHDCSRVRPQREPGRWHGVDVLAYKQDGATPFRDVSRQVLFDDPDLACQMRYFEVGAGGYSTSRAARNTRTR